MIGAWRGGVVCLLVAWAASSFVVVPHGWRLVLGVSVVCLMGRVHRSMMGGA